MEFYEDEEVALFAVYYSEKEQQCKYKPIEATVITFNNQLYLEFRHGFTEAITGIYVSELNKVVSDGKVDVVFCNQAFKEVLKSQYELSYKVVSEINELKNKIAELGELEAKILMKSATEDK